VLIKDNLVKMNWNGVSNIVSVMQMRLLNTYFFIVIMLNLCGAYQIWRLT
jgi:hypothetical protein